MADVGFTGTRHGMTNEQRVTLETLLRVCHPGYFHHGDCVGADDEAATIANRCRANVIAHPATDEKLRAFNRCALATRPAKTYHQRSREIVNESAWLIAAPAEQARVDSGGTWYTVGYAEGQGRPVMVVWPDGRLELLTGKITARQAPAPAGESPKGGA